MDALPDGWEQWTPEQRERWIIAMREIAAMRRNAAAASRAIERSGGRGADQQVTIIRSRVNECI